MLQRCLQKDPAARYQSVHDLIAAFGGQEPALAAAPVPSGEELPHCVAPPLPPPLPPQHVTAKSVPPRRRYGLSVLVLLALREAPAASVSAVRETSVVIATVLAALAAREPLRPSRVAGATIVAGGIALVALAG